MSNNNHPKAIDLFCGGGGLTVGLKKAGFDVVGAVEIEPHAASTYRVNHPKTKLFIQDIKHLRGNDLLALTENGTLDLLAGCPPCQGFTSLTAKYHREDPRNVLLFEMLRLITEVMPKTVMMENVPGLAGRGKPLLDKMLLELEQLGYNTTLAILQVADYGVPQFRRRLVLLAGLRFSISLPNPTHSRNEENGLLPWKTVRDTIFEMEEPLSLSEAKKQAFPPASWNVVRDIHTVNKSRLRAAKAGKSWKTIPEYLRPNCHQGDYSGFPNVYGRMIWDDVSPTITGGCTTLSRGRFGHPQKNRTISVREAAKLQTFPDNYIFDTPFMDRVCNIIGNALPCTFAEAVAKACMNELNCNF
ncbi:MAG: DNA cytosine methyltransferase [Streptococcaceae bacterium]|jgi:DNA (cytosine-5)-methyltransferase 1|nr:DNA cytosine methyltransferase [Streptococcaceae bacterium]